jgi:RNA polymerase sigma-70 factor (subfamily 1)
MASDRSDSDALLRRLQEDDAGAAGELFEHYRGRLRRMVRLRLDRRLQGRVDPSDVLQEAYLDLARRAPEYVADPRLPFFLWLRLLTGQRLLMVHRQHLGAQMRDAGQEVSLYRGPLPQASSASLAAHLLGRLTTPSQAAVRAEMQLRLQEARTSRSRGNGAAVRQARWQWPLTPGSSFTRAWSGTPPSASAASRMTPSWPAGRRTGSTPCRWSVVNTT